jgi:predicted AAA+ superfamily ATPase
MEESKIMEILVDWNLWGNFDRKFLPRNTYLDKILRLFGREALVIKGVRRAGKSSIAYMFLKEWIKPKKENDTLVINFEDPRFPSSLTVDDLTKIYEVYLRRLNPSSKHIVVLDELQRVKKWESFVRWLIDAKNVNVILTGSSSKLMSEEYSTLLTGRHIDIEIFPLNFKEFLYFNGIKIENELDLLKKKNEVFHLLYEFLEFGGFPEIVLTKDRIRKKELLVSYYNDMITKDIVQRFKIKKIEKLDNLSKNYVTNISTIQSFRKLKDLVGLSLDSVERFSKYFEVARLFFFLPKFSFSIQNQMRGMKKVYVVDAGFYNVLGFKFSENIGKVMENVVFVELLRRSSLTGEFEIYYFESNNKEVDFMIKGGKDIKQLIQVCYDVTDTNTKKREMNSLVKASEEIKCKDLIIITWSYEAVEKYKNKEIRFIPLWKWLLI